ncbi:MAG: hypothetical protein IT163_06205 [Bryobacterales bacterium]|nr:hypothetical protein [Bryobacterales bacterium]
MTVGFHSPLPPAPTGVADYSAILLPELQKLLAVSAPPDENASIDLYHLGNNPLHREFYRRALRRPGVVVLHDALLNHFLLGELGEADYADEFVLNYGEWYRGYARELWRNRTRSGVESAYFEWPMIARVCRSSLAVIVHNPGAAGTVLRHAPQARVVEIPHLWSPVAQCSGEDRARLRSQWGVPDGTLVLGVFGHLRETKRLGPILRAFARMRASSLPVYLLVAGDFVSPGVERSFAWELAQPGIVRRGYLPEAEFWQHAGAVDLCLNLRYPSAGESSGIAVRLMGAGRATMLTDGPEIARFPREACLRCDPGLAEEDQILAYCLWALRSPRALACMGEAAAAYIRREHNLASVARLYADTLTGVSRGKQGQAAG